MPPLMKVMIAMILGILSEYYTGEAISTFTLLSIQVFLIIASVLLINKRKISSLLLLSTTVLISHSLSKIYSQNINLQKIVVSKYLNIKKNALVEVNEIKKTKSGFKYTAALKSIEHNNIYIPTNSRILIYSKTKLNNTLPFLAQCSLNISEVENARNPEAFNYKKYLENKGIFYQAFTDSISYLEKSSRLSFQQNMEQKRLRLSVSLKNNLDTIAYTISNALILGVKNELDKETKNTFSNTGSAHVLAVSGLHVGLIYGIIIFFLKNIKLPYYKDTSELIIVTLSLWAFAFITGLSPSVFRATTMLSLYLIGKYFSLYTNIFNIIGLSAILILLINPNQLFDVGFQFSYLALSSIIIFYPSFSSLVNFKFKALQKLWELTVVSISAQVLIFPLSIYYFGQFPIYFWLSGVIVIPMAFSILILGLPLLLCSHFQCLDIITYWFSTTIEVIIKLALQVLTHIESWPFAIIQNLSISNHQLILTYTCLTLFVIFIKTKKSVALALIPIFLNLLTSNSLIEKRRLHAESLLIAYDLKGHSLIEFIHNGYYYTLHKSDVTEEDIYYTSRNFHLNKKLREGNYINLDSTSVLNVNKKANICIDPSMDLFKEGKCDVAFITKNSAHNIKAINHTIANEECQIILDNSIPYKIIKSTAFFNKNIYTIRKSGAFIHYFKS